MSNYCITLGGKRLTSFYANKRLGNQLSFRQSDHYTFDSIENGEDFINYIQSLSNGDTKPMSLQLRVTQID